MKILFENWRKYVNEEVLNEAPPLGDFGYFKGSSSSKSRARTGAGYEDSQDEEGKYKEAVIKFFEDTKDKWYIVFMKKESSLPQYGPIPKGHRGYAELEKIKEEGNWDPKGKYIVANYSNFPSDEDGPSWQIVHDLLGHTIERRGSEWKIRSSYKEWLAEKDISPHPQYLSRYLAGVYLILHDCLPDQFKITPEKSNDDFKNDIYGAIFLENGPMKEKIEELPDKIESNEITVSKESVKVVLDIIVEVIEDFKLLIPRGRFFSFDPF